MDRKNLSCDIAILGGGASGLAAACMCAKRYTGKRIMVLERDSRVGKKLLVTGNGRCNLTNLNTAKENYHGSFANKANFLLENYSPEKVIEFFEGIGLMCKAESDGRVYPRCAQASAVLSVLRNELARLNVEEICDFNATGAQYKNGRFFISGADCMITAQKLIISTGGKANYKGSTDSASFKLLKDFGHNVTKLSPALCPVNVKNDVIKTLKGVRAKGRVSLIISGDVIKSEDGEIQFTSSALSGICVFNLAREAIRQKSCILRVELLPEYSFAEIKTMLFARKKLVKYQACEEIFTGLFHKNIGTALLKTCGISPSKSADKLTDNEINSLAKTISGWDFEVLPVTDYKSAQVTAGGVSGDEIDERTMQSKKQQGLYIIGEAVDIDGDCGGYNLQFAFSSALCAGENI